MNKNWTADLYEEIGQLVTAPTRNWRVQCLIEALYFVSSSVVADSFRLRNRQLLVAAKRYAPL